MKKYKNLLLFFTIVTLIITFMFIPIKKDNKVIKKQNIDSKNQKLIAQIDVIQAETLDYDYLDERSRPTCNPLPYGTVDYCKEASQFYKLNSGHRLYKSSAKTYYGLLPEQNKVQFVDGYVDEGKLVLEFSQSFKAPFKTDYGNLDYKNPYPKNSDRPDYSINEFSCDSFKIEFSYCDEILGNLYLPDNSLFSDIKCENNVLSLTLINNYIFCGYTAEYNEKGNLCFIFTSAQKTIKADNKYGTDLSGKTIMIDAGHGGNDCGAKGESEYYTEAALNLILSKLIKTELESIGATVIMTRTQDREVLLKQRTQLIYEHKPDLFISIHRNASENEDVVGYENYYYYAFSKNLANYVFNSASKSFQRDISVKYYPFYVTRATTCPSILTENGFVSNQQELESIKLYENNLSLAQNTVKGIAEYFLNLN